MEIGHCSIVGNSEVISKKKNMIGKKTVFSAILILYSQHQSSWFPSLKHLGKRWGHFVKSIPCLNMLFSLKQSPGTMSRQNPLWVQNCLSHLSLPLNQNSLATFSGGKWILFFIDKNLLFIDTGSTLQERWSYQRPSKVPYEQLLLLIF